MFEDVALCEVQVLYPLMEDWASSGSMAQGGQVWSAVGGAPLGLQAKASRAAVGGPLAGGCSVLLFMMCVVSEGRSPRCVRW